MNDHKVPVLAGRILELIDGQRKKAAVLEATDKPSQTVKQEKSEDKDVKVKDVELDNTDGTEAAKEMSEGAAPIVDEFTTKGDDTEAVDESSLVMTERGSQRGDPIDAPEKAASVDVDTDDNQTDFLTASMETLLNDQLAFEMYSSYLYYAIAAWSNSKGLTGFYAWFKRQGDDEICHALKIMEYLVDTGSELTFPAIKSPNALIDFKSMEDATKAALEHEMEVTKRWQKIGEKAKTDPNLATQQLAQWFMTEQVEEEDGAVTLHQRVQMAETGAGILVIDTQLLNTDPGE